MSARAGPGQQRRRTRPRWPRRRGQELTGDDGLGKEARAATTGLGEVARAASGVGGGDDVNEDEEVRGELRQPGGVGGRNGRGWGRNGKVLHI